MYSFFTNTFPPRCDIRNESWASIRLYLEKGEVVKAEVLNAIEAAGFNDFELLDELRKMSIVDRYTALQYKGSHADLTDKAFGEPLKEAMYQGVKLGGYSYIDIIVYNLTKEGRIAEVADQLIESYDMITNFAIFLAGFQFVAMSFDGSNNGQSVASEGSSFLLINSFAMSISCALISLFCREYYRFAKDESQDFLFAGICVYKILHRFMSFILLVSVAFSCVAFNIQVYQLFSRVRFAVATNVFYGCNVMVVLSLIVKMTLMKQKYSEKATRFLYDAMTTAVQPKEEK